MSADVFHVVFLICSLKNMPDQSACQRDTALDSIQGPRVENAIMCNKMGQATIAGLAIAPRDGEYLKIVCEREMAG